MTVLVTGSLRISGPRASSSAAAPGESRAERPHTRRPPRVPRPQRQSPCRAATDGGTNPRRAHRGALGVWPATPRLPLTPGRPAARSPACDAPRDSRPAHPGTSVIRADGTSLQLRWLCQTNAQTHDREKRQVSARTRGAGGPRPAGDRGWRQGRARLGGSSENRARGPQRAEGRDPDRRWATPVHRTLFARTEGEARPLPRQTRRGPRAGVPLGLGQGVTVTCAAVWPGLEGAVTREPSRTQKEERCPVPCSEVPGGGRRQWQGAEPGAAPGRGVGGAGGARDGVPSGETEKVLEPAGAAATRQRDWIRCLRTVSLRMIKTANLTALRLCYSNRLIADEAKERLEAKLEKTGTSPERDV